MLVVFTAATLECVWLLAAALGAGVGLAGAGLAAAGAGAGLAGDPAAAGLPAAGAAAEAPLGGAGAALPGLGLLAIGEEEAARRRRMLTAGPRVECLEVSSRLRPVRRSHPLAVGLHMAAATLEWLQSAASPGAVPIQVAMTSLRPFRQLKLTLGGPGGLCKQHHRWNSFWRRRDSGAERTRLSSPATPLIVVRLPAAGLG